MLAAPSLDDLDAPPTHELRTTVAALGLHVADDADVVRPSACAALDLYVPLTRVPLRCRWRPAGPADCRP